MSMGLAKQLHAPCAAQVCNDLPWEHGTSKPPKTYVLGTGMRAHQNCNLASSARCKCLARHVSGSGKSSLLMRSVMNSLTWTCVINKVGGLLDHEVFLARRSHLVESVLLLPKQHEIKWTRALIFDLGTDVQFIFKSCRAVQAQSIVAVVLHDFLGPRIRWACGGRDWGWQTHTFICGSSACGPAGPAPPASYSHEVQ